MLGKAGLIWVLFCLCTTVYAANGPGPFTSFVEFLSALEEMPEDEFLRMAEETPALQLKEYHRSLSSLDPSHFERWNQKLRLIDVPGFGRGTNYWELHAKGPDLTIGFHPEPKPQAFESIADFYHSIRNDDVALFQKRVDLSSAEDLNRWLEILSVKNEALFEEALIKAMLIGNIGYRPAAPYRLPEAPPSPRPIGFNPAEDLQQGLKPIKTVQELIEAFENSTPEEFQRRLQMLSQQKAARLLASVKKSNKGLYLEMLRKARSRTRIGFTTTGQPEVIGPEEGSQSPKEIGFKQASRPCSDFLKPE